MYLPSHMVMREFRALDGEKPTFRVTVRMEDAPILDAILAPEDGRHYSRGLTDAGCKKNSSV